MSDCLVCQHPLNADELGRTACPHCQLRIGHQLDQLPGLYRLLAYELAPAGGGHGPAVSGSRTDRLPLNEDVLELRGWSGMLGTLLRHETEWRRALRLPLTPPRGTAEKTVTASARFLREHLWWACEKYPGIEEFAEHVADLHSAAESIVAPTDPRKRPTRAGLCPALVGEEETCGAVLLLYPGSEVLTCSWCGVVYPQSVWGQVKVWQDEDAAPAEDPQPVHGPVEGELTAHQPSVSHPGVITSRM